MKPIEITVSKTLKIPVPGQPYSSQESYCSITASLTSEDPISATTQLYKMVNEQVYLGIKGGVQDALT